MLRHFSYLLILVINLASAAAADPMKDAVVAQLDEIYRRASVDGDFKAASTEIDLLFDQVATWAPARDHDVIRDVAFARRLAFLLSEIEESERIELAMYLRSHRPVAEAFAWLVRPAYEDVNEIFTLFNRIRQKRPKQVIAFPALTAAICVVHDKPLSRRINENKPRAADPLALFDYFVANESRMLFGLKNVPPELLIYVVDSTTTVREMQWALDRFAGDTNIGAQFFKIEYDYDHFRTGRPKKCTLAGWTLPAILEHGGICADQTYFAMSVGKAIGVPTTYTRGRAAEGSHAWVGFLQADRRMARWNFNTGRYPAYQGVRGTTIDPQIRRRTPDSYISLLAHFVTATKRDRQLVAAVNDMVRQLADLNELGAVPPPRLDGGRDTPRRGTVAEQLELLELGLRACPGYGPAWFTVRALAADGSMTLADKKKWAKVLHRLCGQHFPDFYLAVLGPMIETVNDPDEQNKLWDAAFRSFQRRGDLAATVRMKQAELWMQYDKPMQAGKCYEDVISRYAAAGPYVRTALARAEGLLRGDRQRILALYKRAWTSVPKPQGSFVFKQTNWYQIGATYADRLGRFGFERDAANVRVQLAP